MPPGPASSFARYLFWRWEYQRRNAEFCQILAREIAALRDIWSDPMARSGEELRARGIAYGGRRDTLQDAQGRSYAGDTIYWTVSIRNEQHSFWASIGEDGQPHYGLFLQGCRMEPSAVNSAALLAALAQGEPLPVPEINVVDSIGVLRVKKLPSGPRGTTLLEVDLGAPMEHLTQNLLHLRGMFWPNENPEAGQWLDMKGDILRSDGATLGRATGDLARAKGVYVWDRVHIDGLTQSAAVEQLATLLPHGDIELEDELWRYRITSECIEKIDFIPMTKHRN